MLEQYLVCDECGHPIHGHAYHLPDGRDLCNRCKRLDEGAPKKMNEVIWTVVCDDCGGTLWKLYEVKNTSRVYAFCLGCENKRNLSEMGNTSYPFIPLERKEAPQK